jgi:hypothetical protein
MQRGFLNSIFLILLMQAFLAVTATCLAQENGLTVLKTSDGIIIKNVSDKTVYYTIYPNRILPLIEWAPCTPKDEWCTGLQPEEEFLFPGNEPSTLFWWEIHERKDGTPVPGKVFSVNLAPER